MENISISLSECGINNTVSEVRIDGVIDTLTAGELEEVIDSLVKRQRYNIVIDLAGVDYISSAGWGIFISHIKDLRLNGGDIKLANMIPNVYEIYELLEFDKVLQAYNSVDAARDKFETQLVEAGVLKKKDQKITRVTVVNEIGSSSRGTHQLYDGQGEFTDGDSGNIEMQVMRLVRQDPFMSIFEIKQEINNHGAERNIGWWGIFSILKKKGLLKKKSRFKYARKQF
ncbi:MAG: STAS domain-containing protein [Candidatus Zixiibacteriota bacterium]